jgi:peptide/nickel transport system permease protein
MSGDPTSWLINPKVGPELRKAIIKSYGLDKSIAEQFVIYVRNVLMGNFGDSFYYSRPALNVILQRMPSTLLLTCTGLLIACLIAIPLGVYAAAFKDSTLDYVSRGISFFAISAPGFWVGIILILVFSINLKLLPAGGIAEPGSLILPAVTLALSLLGTILRLTRSGMLDVLNSEYIKLARAKGAGEKRVIWVHAFKNASTPVITTIVLLMINVLSGDVVVEQVFSWPGIGRMIMQAVGFRDYPLIQAFTLLIGVVFVIFNIIADILYAVVDPKIRNFS